MADSAYLRFLLIIKDALKPLFKFPLKIEWAAENRAETNEEYGWMILFYIKDETDAATQVYGSIQRHGKKSPDATEYIDDPYFVINLKLRLNANYRNSSVVKCHIYEGCSELELRDKVREAVNSLSDEFKKGTLSCIDNITKELTDLENAGIVLSGLKENI